MQVKKLKYGGKADLHPPGAADIRSSLVRRPSWKSRQVATPETDERKRMQARKTGILSATVIKCEQLLQARLGRTC